MTSPFEPKPDSSTPNRSAARDGRLASLILGIMFLPTGLQAAFTPRSFFDDFPLGRGWIALGGEAYNEHLVRDVGGLFLALSLLSLWAWRNQAVARPALVAWLVQGTLHVSFHLRHLAHFGGVNRVGLIMTLTGAPAIAIVGLLAMRKPATPQP